MNLRHHLLATCSECEILTKLYKKQLTSLDNEECHAHLRCVPFDLSLRLPGDKTLEYFVSQAREVGKGDSRLDRYNPAKLHLAVQELDEKHVGCFSFRTKADINKVCKAHTVLYLKVTIICRYIFLQFSANLVLAKGVLA